MIGKKFFTPMAVVATTLACCVASPAFGEVTFDWAPIHNPGNTSDPVNSPGGECELDDECIPGIGSVGYDYRIAKFEVTNDQYAEFLNAVASTDTNALYNSTMDSDARGGITRSGSSGSFIYSVKTNMGNKPVILVSYFDAMRFVNWLHNGQPTGAQDADTTEDGVYAISDGVAETRAVDASFFIPTENEWYKAAYHQPSTQGGDTDDYWVYPTASNSIPTIASANATGDISNPGANVANYNFGADWNSLDGNLTTVGSAGTASESFYGTSDQGGNVNEWHETLVGEGHVLRGGTWNSSELLLRSSIRDVTFPSLENINIGFRVASPVPPIPTVSEWGLAAMALLLLSAGTIVYGKRGGRAT